MTIAIAVYILLLIVFLIVSSLIVRHLMKFGYLSPNFKYVVIVFGVISLTIIIFSIYLLFLVGGSDSSNYYDPYINTGGSSGDLNF